MRLPHGRGPISDELINALTSGDPLEPPSRVASQDPLADEDLQLALYALYELHYAGFDGVDPDAEWRPDLIALRAALEDVFEQALAELVPASPLPSPDTVGAHLFELAAADQAPSPSRYLATEGTLDEFREFVIHRSAYQLKEADPHSWAIPRLYGAPKAALLEVQSDEYGSGKADRIHAHLFGQAMDALGLDGTYGVYLDSIPGLTLATVNLMSLFGLHRRLRGASVGHLAMFEMTSPDPNRRYGNALRRLGVADPRALDFFDEHVEADSVHENIAAYDMAGGLAAQQPELTGDIVFGARALLALEGLWAGALLDAFAAGRSSLLAGSPLAQAAPSAA